MTARFCTSPFGSSSARTTESVSLDMMFGSICAKFMLWEVSMPSRSFSDM